jgi:benzoate-CoA ligase family protein
MALPDIPERLNAATVFIDEHLTQGRGEQVAVRWRDEVVTYRQLAVQVNKTGNALHRLGVRPEERVLLVVLDSPAFVYSFWGALKIGAIPVPVNTALRSEDYAYLVGDSRATTLIVSAELWPIVAPVVQSRSIQTIIVGSAQEQEMSRLAFTEWIESEAPALDPEPTHRDDAAFWLYSSGSTGTPKAAVHQHRNLVFCSDTYAREILAIGPDDVTLAAPRLFFAYGLGGGMNFALGVGATAALVSERPTPDGMFAAIQNYKPTIFFGVPTLYAAMLQVKDAAQQYDLSSVRVCVSAGEPLPSELFTRWQERFGVEILDGIGTTEALHIFLSNRAGQVRPGSSGLPVAGYEIQLRNEDGRAVAQGETGDLLVKGGSLTSGYWRKREISQQALCGEWLRTGDKYYQDAAGYYWYCGRADDMLKVSGQWVSPTEVEGLLFAHPAVLEAAVVGWEDTQRLIKPKAFVVLKEGHVPSPALGEELSAFVKARTLPHKYPRWVEFVSELPKTTTGKIQRYKLRTAQREKMINAE